MAGTDVRREPGKATKGDPPPHFAGGKDELS